jgi:hypothetical protein
MSEAADVIETGDSTPATEGAEPQGSSPSGTDWQGALSESYDRARVDQEQPAESETAPEAAAEADVDEQPADRQTPETAEQPKLPQSYRKALQDKWDRLDPELRDELARLDRARDNYFRKVGEDRKLGGSFREVVAPYEPMFASAGVSAPQAVGVLLKTYAQLQSAPLPERAQIVANLFREFVGTDENGINLLAAAIEGTPGATAQPAPQRPEPDITPEQITTLVRQYVGEQYAEAEREAAFTTVRDFEATRPEFLNEVRVEMAAIANVEHARGKRMTVDDLRRAYHQACQMNPHVSQAIKQREDAKRAQVAAASTRRAKAASSSIRSTPVGSPAPMGDDWGSHVNAAWDKASRGDR